jgi:PAS domain S-box-containing protein
LEAAKLLVAVHKPNLTDAHAHKTTSEPVPHGCAAFPESGLAIIETLIRAFAVLYGAAASEGPGLRLTLRILPVEPVMDANKPNGTNDLSAAAVAQLYLAAIVESSDDAIITKNLDGVIQSCNAAAERLFGYKPPELIGQSVRILIPPDRQAEEDEILARIRRGERVDHFETVRLAKDGRQIDISLTVSPVRDASGAIIGVSKVARDITERRRAAAALAAQQEWFRVTLASIGDGIIASDPDGRVTYMNSIAETLTGWTNENAQGVSLTDVFHIVNETTRQPLDNPAGMVIRSGHIMGLANHTVLISRDGTERPIADSAAPILDDAGAILGVVLVFRDFTEQRRAAEAIAEQREWFETTLESIGDAVIATDVRGRVVFMNPVAEHLTGWRMDTARDRACTEVFNIVNEKTLRVVENPVTRILQEGVVVGLANHTLLIAADGTERPIDDSGAPIRNREGRIVGVVLVFRDVSERRRAEAERELAAREHERLLVAERTARAEAERANRLKDDFVAMVSHELRTPLNAILGWTELMLKKRDDEALAARGLEIVARNTKLQTQLIADLLDISRIVSGKLRLDMQSVHLASIVEGAIETVEHAADAKGIAIDRQLDRSIGPMAGDPARLQQVVWNLLSNALKFTTQGGRVRVILRRAGSHAEIVVEDNGVGIRPDFLPHVFDRFQQADASRARRFGGLGLGLSIVQNLVQFHGGTVRAESDGEGHGATFTISLPLAAPPVLLETALGPTASTKRVTDGVSLAGTCVLLVEDEADAAAFVKQLLEDYGAVVVIATSARQALEIIETTQPDILISDIGLPEMDGYELLEQVRRKEAADGAGIPAIALTAFARSEDRTRALLAGYQAHLAKPIESTELVATVASFAELAAAQRAHASGDRHSRQ